MSASGPTILIASDTPSDADLVKRLLDKDFAHIGISVLEARAVADFEQQSPDVLVLAFKTVEASERYYLGLYRHSSKVSAQPHRTIVLCDKDEVQRVSRLCFKQYFDDYVLFWPMNYDAPRLAMAIHLAQRDLQHFHHDSPAAAQFAAQARRLAELETLLAQFSSAGLQHTQAAQLAVDTAQREVRGALDSFSRTMDHRASTDAAGRTTVDGLQGELARLRQEQIEPQFQAVRQAVQPVERWTAEFQQRSTAPLESIRALTALAAQVKPMILVVDDDTFQHKIIAKILTSELFQLTYSSGGADALNFLRRAHVDLILMDVQMPGMDGLETLRRIKTMPHLVSTPLVMVSGKSEGNTVVQCLKSGAADFVVKPFDRDTLLGKVARLSGLAPMVRKPAS